MNEEKWQIQGQVQMVANNKIHWRQKFKHYKHASEAQAWTLTINSIKQIQKTLKERNQADNFIGAIVLKNCTMQKLK